MFKKATFDNILTGIKLIIHGTRITEGKKEQILTACSKVLYSLNTRDFLCRQLPSRVKFSLFIRVSAFYFSINAKKKKKRKTYQPLLKKRSRTNPCLDVENDDEGFFSIFFNIAREITKPKKRYSPER